MAKRIPMTLLAAAASLAAILPLRGDPRNAPVTHPEWARMLLRAFDVPDAVRATPRASHAFAALSWKTSLAFRGDDFATGDHVEIAAEIGFVIDGHRHQIFGYCRDCAAEAKNRTEARR